MNLRELGFNVIPCLPKSKLPAIKWGEFQTKKFEGLLAENNAIVCGVTSGNLVVIDLDDPTLAELVFNDFTAVKNRTLVVETGKKGFHVYLKAKGQLPRTLRITHPDGRHLDIQSQGAYVMAPGSIHPETLREYKVISNTLNVVEGDIDGIINELRNLGFKGMEGLPPVNEIAKGVKSGSRNNAAFKYACATLQRVDLNQDMARAEMEMWNERCEPPLPKIELESVFKSAVKRVKPLPLQTGKKEENLEIVGVRSIRSISAKDEGKVITFNAFIAQVGEYRTVGKVVNCICTTCDVELEVEGNGYVNPRLPKCKKCKVNMQIKNMVTTNDMLEIVLQEIQEEVKNNTPIRLMGRVIEDNVSNIFPGEQKQFTGKFKSYSERGQKDNDPVILIESFESLTEPEDVCLTQAELEKLKPLINMENLRNCVAPDLLGLDLAKEILLMTLVGGEQMGSRRGEINTIFVGNPGRGKTELLKFAELITSNSSYANGKSSSGPGLVYAMVKMPDGTMRPQAGIMVMNKFVFLDEFDKMTESDMYYLLETIESHTAHMHKGGHTVGVSANAAVIFAANPQFGKWQNDRKVLENLNIPPPMLSRMDWIIGFIKSNSVLEGMIADHILGDVNDREKTIMTPLELKHYLNYVRKLKPTATKEAKQKLKEYYMKTIQVMEDGENLPMEPRQLIGFYRSAMARNKLLMKEVIDEQDADEIINLHRKSLESLGLKIEGNTVQSMFDDSKVSKEKAIMKVWHILTDNEQTVSKEEFFKKLIELYPHYFEDQYSCEEMWEKHEKRFLLQPNGRHRMSL